MPRFAILCCELSRMRAGGISLPAPGAVPEEELQPGLLLQGIRTAALV